MEVRKGVFFKGPTFLLGVLFLFLVNVNAQKPPLKLKVVTEQANIRLKPDIGSIIIQQVSQGTILESSGKAGEWYRVEIKTPEVEVVSGYVHQSLVIVISPPSEKEKKEEKKEETIETPPPPIIPPSAQPSEYAFDFSFFGGGNLISGGDLNKGAQGFADFYSDTLAIKGKGKVRPVRLSYIYGGELSFPLFSFFSLGMGADYFLVKKESRVKFEKNSSTDTYITRPKIRALPLRVFFTFYPFPYFYLKGGLEYYFAKCSYFYRYQTEEAVEEWEGEAKAQDFGFLGGVGFEWKLSPSLSFIIEATGRYAQITGFKGEGKHKKYKDSAGSVSTEEGRLYFYQKIRIPDEPGYPYLLIHHKKPSVDVSDPKEATLDLSGFSLKVGLKIRF